MTDPTRPLAVWASIVSVATFNAYLALERKLVSLPDRDGPAGDEIRDRMDILWLHLTSEQRAKLDARTPQQHPD
jgi:hypothetical protein